MIYEGYIYTHTQLAMAFAGSLLRVTPRGGASHRKHPPPRPPPLPAPGCLTESARGGGESVGVVGFEVEVIH